MLRLYVRGSICGVEKHRLKILPKDLKGIVSPDCWTLALRPSASHNAGVSASTLRHLVMWGVQPGGQFLALMGAPVPQAGQSGMPVGVQVAQAPRPPQYGCARSSEEENVVHTPTPGGSLPPSRVCSETRGPSPPRGGGALGSDVGVVFRDPWACDLPSCVGMCVREGFSPAAAPLRTRAP